MSFYNGRPGQSFKIKKAFNTVSEMVEELQIKEVVNDNLTFLNVYPEEFVLLLAETDINEVTTDTLNSSGNTDFSNSSIWIKQADESEEFKFKYIKVGVIGGIIPEIDDITGMWVLGGVNSGQRATAREVEFNIDYKRQPAQYTLIKKEEVYGLADLSIKYIYNEFLDNYVIDDNGTFVLAYYANENNEFIYKDGFLQEIGYIDSSEWEKINYVSAKYTTDWLQWRYYGESDWRDLFEITDLVNLEFYRNEAMQAAQTAEKYFDESSKLAKEIEEAKESIDKTEETLKEKISEAQGYSDSAITSYEKTKELIDAIVQFEYGEADSKDAVPPNGIVYEVTEDGIYKYKIPISSSVGTEAITTAEVIKARDKFSYLDERLDNMPYQFDTITKMQSCATLSEGDRIFTFGRDNIGDGDSSKLFQVFSPDDERLNEIVEGSISDKDPEGIKKIAEQYELVSTENGKKLIAGLLTVFSGTGSGGGGSAVPSITANISSSAIKEGENVIIDYYWTGPVAGTATLFITDSNKNSPNVVDAIDESKVYSKGVPITTGFGAGSVTLKPSKGEHTYSIYVIDRAQNYSNTQMLKVIVGGINITNVSIADGKRFNTTEAITYVYTINTIYSKPSILQYNLYRNGSLYANGEVKSNSSSAGNQSVVLNIKNKDQFIDSGDYRLEAKAYPEDDINSSTKSIIRTFIVPEPNVVYITTSFEDDGNLKAEKSITIPLNISYAVGANFEIEGRYSTNSNFNKDTYLTGTQFEFSSVLPAEGKASFQASFPSEGTYYVLFKVVSTIDGAEGYLSTPLKLEIGEAEGINDYLLYNSDLYVYYNADKGQSNESSIATRRVWKNLSKETSDANTNGQLMNFNYSSNGWESKEIRQPDGSIIKKPTGYLNLTSDSYLQSNYNFLKSIQENAATKGGTFEINFKTLDLGKDQVVATVSNGVKGSNTGIFVYKDKVTVNVDTWGINQLTAYFNPNGIEEKDKAVHVAVVFDPGFAEGHEKAVKIFVNGVLSKAISDTTVLASLFSSIGTGTTISPFLINRLNQTEGDIKNGIVKVDTVRFYHTALSDIDILKNYIYSIHKPTEEETRAAQAKLLTKNYLDNEDKDAVPDNIPSMTFYLTKDQWETMTKDVKHNITLEYYDPNDLNAPDTLKNGRQGYRWEKVKTSWQGTSSIAYPVKNFKCKLPSKYYLRGKDKSLGEKTFCLKADYMDSSHCHNTGNANLIHESGLLTNYSLTPAQSKELNISVKDGYSGLTALKEKGKIDESFSPDDLKTRTCIYGHPTILYIALESEENPGEYEQPMFWGVYNFNLDKGATSSFGLNRGLDKDSQSITSFEVSANTAFSGGGFRALRFVKNKNNNKHGWTRYNVTYSKENDKTYFIDLEKGSYLDIALANEDGRISATNQKINYYDEETNKDYIAVYNNNLNVKGFYNPQERYSQINDEYVLSDVGNYILLFEIDESQEPFAPKQSDGQWIKIGYYDYYGNIASWSENVPVLNSLYEEKDNWEVIADPENLDYKYNYYVSDFELRYPDEGDFDKEGGGKNKLFYKEYDKLIKMVEWVDQDEETFKTEFENHWDKNTVINYYLYLMSTGMIDNFGKNLMIDTWGYNKNGEVPYLTKEDGKYHCVYKFDEEHDEIVYGWMDISTFETIIKEDGTEKQVYKVYQSDKNYAAKGELIDSAVWYDQDGGIPTAWTHEIDETDIIWYPHFYDLDSCLGVNNAGELTFSPSIEMADKFYINALNNKIDSAPFNTSSSAFWQKVVNVYEKDISKRFLEELSINTLNMTTFTKYYYNNIIDQLCERLYNLDAIPKYLSSTPIKVVVSGSETTRVPFAFDHLATGTDWERISSWLEKRLAYLASMYKKDIGAAEKNSAIGFRTAVGGVDYSIKVECYDPCYIALNYLNAGGDSGVIYKRISESNGEAIFTFPSPSDDQEIFFSPPQNIKSLQEITNFGFQQFIGDQGTRLLSIDLSNSASLSTFSLSDSQYLLQKLNLQGCSGLQSTSIAGSSFPYLEEINTMESTANFTFSEKGGALKIAKLSGTNESLNIQNYNDLEDLTLQIDYSEPPTNLSNPPDIARYLIEKKAVGYGNYTNINISNCQKLKININARYPQTIIENGQEKIVMQTVGKEPLRIFEENYGLFSLFPSLVSLQLQSSFQDIEPKNQLQLDKITINDNIKELRLSLANLNLLRVVDCGYNKIAFVHRDGKNIGYPGWGGEYSKTGDSNYITALSEGIIGDKNIEELEFRSIYRTGTEESKQLPQATGVFYFPWRTYLGTLKGLKKLKFFGSISQKNVTSSQDSHFTTRPSTVSNSAQSWKPSRFELILPKADSSQDITLDTIYFYKSEEDSQERVFDFTCIRQPDENNGFYLKETPGSSESLNILLSDSWINSSKWESGKIDSNVSNYFNLIKVKDENEQEINYYHFTGVDLRGYKDLVMNFASLKNITGIMGMEALSVEKIDAVFSTNKKSNAFSGYFKNCGNLKMLHKINSMGKYEVWDFSDWFQNYGKYFVDLSQGFYNCSSLTEKYLKGIFEARNLFAENMQNIFYNTGINEIDLSWDSPRALKNIRGIFSSCKSLTRFNGKILGVLSDDFVSLDAMFQWADNLENFSLLMTNGKRTGENHWKNIQSVDSMFLGCKNLKEIDLSITDKNGYLSGINPCIYDFSGLINASNWFSGCSELKTVIFENNVNFTKLQRFNNGFLSCENLVNIFADNTPNFGNGEAALTLASLFNGCKALSNLNGFWDINSSRINSLESTFAATAIAIADLENWVFNNPIRMSSAFSNCVALQNIKMPLEEINILTCEALFNTCNQLSVIENLNSLNIEESKSLSMMFANCSSLSADNFTGYENWNVSNIENFNSMFAKTPLIILDFTNWKNTAKQVSLSNMFQGCDKLENIICFGELFGTYDENRKAINDTRKILALDSLFEGCSSLDFISYSGLKEGEITGTPVVGDLNLSAWSKMVAGISSVKKMFSGCKKLDKLESVFMPKSNAITNSKFKFYWGNMDIGCGFTALADFESICQGCTGLISFKYFDETINTGVGYINSFSINNITGMVQKCSNLEEFSFKLRNAKLQDLHSINTDLSTLFENDNKLTNIQFLAASRPGNILDNKGIKFGFNFNSEALTKIFFESVTLKNNFINGLYDFISNELKTTGLSFSEIDKRLNDMGYTDSTKYRSITFKNGVVSPDVQDALIQELMNTIGWKAKFVV